MPDKKSPCWRSLRHPWRLWHDVSLWYQSDMLPNVFWCNSMFSWLYRDMSRVGVRLDLLGVGVNMLRVRVASVGIWVIRTLWTELMFMIGVIRLEIIYQRGEGWGQRNMEPSVLLPAPYLERQGGNGGRRWDNERGGISKGILCR